ncbi:DUF2512 family protein [Alkalihalobacillus sp. 1P02AB]|uniref:DUF2512 family protein n=1 Tax=Alkalihalobacillus sp. 1P02AB TaxID=3132260 RepID=UPI0039A41B57
MQYFKALLLKWVISFAFLFIIFGLFYHVSIGNVFVLSLVVSVVSYLGDLFIMPRISNTVATITDFGLALFLIWFVSQSLTNGANLFFPSLLAATGLAIFEYYYHQYLLMYVLNNGEKLEKRTAPYRYQTEASEEIAPNKEEIERDDDSK